jgi:hypothetical protein
VYKERRGPFGKKYVTAEEREVVKRKIDMCTKCYFKIKYTIRNEGPRPRNRKEVYGLIRNAVYPKKVNKATKCDSLIQKMATVVFKMNYWKHNTRCK